MAGHSKWATTKRKKGALDAKRGALFTKLGKNISVAARNGKDPEMNPALRTAINQARNANMPKDNIEKAILKGAGELPGAVYESVTYEGYAPGGIALIIDCVTDNTNRTVSFVRSTLTKNNGSLANAGSVLYMFEQKGVVMIETASLHGTTQDDLELLAIDAGAEDIQAEDEGITIITSREGLNDMVSAVEEAGIEMTSSGLEWITQNMITPESADAEQVQTLIDILEEDDDVTAVHSNANL